MLGEYIDWTQISLAAVVSVALLWWHCLRKRKECETLEERFHEEFSIAFKDLLMRECFISSELWHRLVAHTRDLYEQIRSSKHRYLSGTDAAISEFENVEQIVREHNDRYCESELNRNAAFFDTIAPYPLDSQQRLACVRDECASLVVAGAGSGKTSVVMAKVAYLVEVKKVDPSDILLLTFARKAAKEMSDRVAQCLGEGKIEARTFHSFGSDMILRLGKNRHAIAPESLLLSVVHEALTGKRVFTPEGYENILDYCMYYFDPGTNEKGDVDDESVRDAVYAIGEKVTYRGEVVKSLEEAMIANFLYLNGVDYQYEMPYPKSYERDGKHIDYRPDFYLPEYNVYIEHFGVDKNGEPPRFYSQLEQKEYKDGMDWKRRLHFNNGTILVESYSWWNHEHRLCENLRTALEKQGVRFVQRDAVDVLEMIREKAGDKISGLEQLLGTFISLFKTKGFGSEKFAELSSNVTGGRYYRDRTRSFLRLSKEVYETYEQELRNRGQYDFDDMIIEATRLLKESRRGTLRYKYVIVDEFQDMSTSRAMFLKEILAQSDARLFCVGDDWQSIYRFAGSDVSIFTDFGSYFGYYDRLCIDNTYRNSQELIDLMGAFITENKAQIPKRLRSAKRCRNPIVGIPYDGCSSAGRLVAKAKALDVAIRKIVAECGEGETSVLILGRHVTEGAVTKPAKSLIRSNEELYRVAGHKNIEVRFMTVHKAKGSEADYVILLNAENDIYGFPNQIADDPLMQLVMAKPDSYPFAEERRLFYVAMTRTRNRTYVLIPKRNESLFIRDLRCLLKVQNHALKHDGHYCPLCGSLLVRRKNGATGNSFIGCSAYPACRYTQPVCSHTQWEGFVEETQVTSS